MFLCKGRTPVPQTPIPKPRTPTRNPKPQAGEAGGAGERRGGVSGAAAPDLPGRRRSVQGLALDHFWGCVTENFSGIWTRIDVSGKRGPGLGNSFPA